MSTILVVANETLGGAKLLEAIQQKAGSDDRIVVCVPRNRPREGYVIYAPGIAPIYLLSDKKGGYVLQRPGESASFVIPMKDGNGWNILQANAPATLFMRNPNGAGWILLPPGELPTLVLPDPQ